MDYLQLIDPASRPLRILRAGRFSNDEGGTYSIHDQDMLTAELCLRHGWHDLGFIGADGESGGSMERSDVRRLEAMLADDPLSVDGILYVDDSRYTRNAEATTLWEDRVLGPVNQQRRRAGLPPFEILHVNGIRGDRDDPSVSLGKRMVRAVNTFYREDGSGKTKRGLRRRVKDGYWPHRAPDGYQRRGKGKDKADWTPNDAELVPHATRAAIIRRAFALRQTGLSADRIAATLNSEGHVTREGNRWNRNAVSGLLANPLYAGILHVRGRALRTGEGGYQFMLGTPLVSVETWEACRPRDARRKGRKPEPGRYLFEGLLTCGQFTVDSPSDRRGQQVPLLCRAEGGVEFYRLAHTYKDNYTVTAVDALASLMPVKFEARPLEDWLLDLLGDDAPGLAVKEGVSRPAASALSEATAALRANQDQIAVAMKRIRTALDMEAMATVKLLNDELSALQTAEAQLQARIATLRNVRPAPVPDARPVSALAVARAAGDRIALRNLVTALVAKVELEAVAEDLVGCRIYLRDASTQEKASGCLNATQRPVLVAFAQVSLFRRRARRGRPRLAV